MSMHKDPESWARGSPFAVAEGSAAQLRNVLTMALDDIAELARIINGERDARQKYEVALRAKDAAMGVLFDRLTAVGIDCSDLIS